jgi:hypothetical protein
LALLFDGRATAQAVSRRLHTAAARVRDQVRSCGICGGQSGTGAGFLRVRLFPQTILIPPNSSHSSSGAGTIGQLVADVPIGLGFTPPQETKKNYASTMKMEPICSSESSVDFQPASQRCKTELFIRARVCVCVCVCVSVHAYVKLNES